MTEEVESLIPGTAKLMEEGETKIVKVDPQIFIVSFPKCGTHLVEQLISPLAYPMPADKPWAGTFNSHSWTTQWIPLKKTLRRIGYIRDGTYAKGHLGYKPEIENFLFGIGAAVIFVYRDPRDVAVSLTHHILNDGMHGANEWYKDLGFDGALLAVIQGLGIFAGVMERWEYYAPWLDAEWVYSVKFEDLIADRVEQSKTILRYIVGHSANVRGFTATLEEEQLDEWSAKMVENSNQTDKSPTFRVGKSGGWKEAFKDAHIVAFQHSDKNDWLVKLGYEEDSKWGIEYLDKDTQEEIEV
jgi:hypothetical protein